jgi:heparosan-N-sulfate-glucuronate 5-epimerase
MPWAALGAAAVRKLRPVTSPRQRLTRFLSTTFDEPIGSHIEPEGVRGYYLDMRVKAFDPDPATAWPYEYAKEAWVVFCQLGLGAYERYLAGDGEQWLALARHVADVLIDHQEQSGARRGAFVHTYDFPHTFPVRAPWISSMAQGEGASLFVRIHRETGDERYADAARLALEPISIRTPDGGAMNLLDGRPFPEEYPTEPPSFVLNGGIFSLWGMYDVGRGLGDDAAMAAFEDGVDTLAANLHRWDTGWWSLYDIYPHPQRNVASSAYHQLHIDQLRAMAMIAPREELLLTADRFESYGQQRRNVVRAFVEKSAFRLRVPRNRLARPLA